MDLKSTLLVVGGSACSFKLLNMIIRFLPTPEPARKKCWKWRNISTSLAYSSLTEAWAVLQFLHSTSDVEDMISSYSLLSYSHVAVSTGYFIHDFLDAASNQSCKQSWEVHFSFLIQYFQWDMHIRMPRYILMMGTAGLSLISIMNIVLFYRLLRANILTVSYLMM
ncbi:TLC domain-containing protein 2-like [Perca fluviatilis]|uniref:TLC domain-containing protein 2-like n=1 Tax=Perca fluviatilis TaxID=8168 RepID=UPI001962680B|nr:TLC domain-containing protein 2-like [Perca fluviatilis]